jgi:C1A family cysteine protease
MDRKRLVYNGVQDVGLGWLPDLPDVRDYTPATPKVDAILAQAAVPMAASQTPEKAAEKLIDLRPHCTPVDHQGDLNACSAYAAAGLVEYYVKKTQGQTTKVSRNFIYKATRSYLGFTGDSGAYMRSTVGALALFGAPLERFWPSDPERFDDEPPAFCYALGQSAQALTYYRLDPPGTAPEQVLSEVKRHLAGEMPTLFGFTVYSSIESSGDRGNIAFPGKQDSVIGGHAVLAVGYDDSRKIRISGSKKYTTGAILVRNSWGEEWGEGGYGYLPYDYVLCGLAKDWWVVVKAEWVETAGFDA